MINIEVKTDPYGSKKDESSINKRKNVCKENVRPIFRFENLNLQFGGYKNNNEKGIKISGNLFTYIFPFIHQTSLFSYSLLCSVIGPNLRCIILLSTPSCSIVPGIRALRYVNLRAASLSWQPSIIRFLMYLFIYF